MKAFGLWLTMITVMSLPVLVFAQATGSTDKTSETTPKVSGKKGSKTKVISKSKKGTTKPPPAGNTDGTGRKGSLPPKQ